MADLSKFGDLTRAEDEFVRAAISGEECILGDGTLPDLDRPEQGADRAIRGELVRWLALGGGEGAELHASGVALRGAHITGHLDLSGATSDCDLQLVNCRVSRAPRLKGTHLRSLCLDGSAVPGLVADGLRVDGSLSLAEGFSASGQVSISRARIGADLDCTCGAFSEPEGDALHVDGSEIGGSVFLMGRRNEDDVKPFRCTGTARFISCTVGDSFMAVDAAFDAGERKYGLSLVLAEIRRQLTIKRFLRFRGRLNLSGASCYSLNDDPNDPEAPRSLILNGFSYVHFSGKAPMDVPTRLIWLDRQSPEDYGQDFWPQPYGQLAKVLTATGHEADARAVMVEKEARQGRIAVKQAVNDGRKMDAWRIWLGDQFLRRVIGYGYRPQQGVILMIAIWLATAAFFHQTWQAGDMAPSAPPILVSSSWAESLRAEPVHTAAYWTGQTDPGRDYETFNSAAYAFDLFVPLLDLGQESSWAPSTSRGVLGRIGYWLRWLVEIVGWVMTALAAAAVTGLVRRE